MDGLDCCLCFFWNYCDYELFKVGVGMIDKKEVDLMPSSNRCKSRVNPGRICVSCGKRITNRLRRNALRCSNCLVEHKKEYRRVYYKKYYHLHKGK